MHFEEWFVIQKGVLRRYQGPSGIEQLVIPEGVTEILTDALEGLKGSLRQIVLPDGITRLGYRLFSGFSRLESVSLPGSLRIIPASCFSHCPALRQVTLHEGLRIISDKAFSFTPVPRLHIPASVQRIGDYTVRGVFSPETVVSVHPDNPYYCMENGVLAARPYHEEGGFLSVIPQADPAGHSIPLYNAADHTLCHTKRIRLAPEQAEAILALCRGYRYQVETAYYEGNDDYNIETLCRSESSFAAISQEDVVIQDGQLLGFRRESSYLPVSGPDCAVCCRGSYDQLSVYRYERTTCTYRLCKADPE